MAQPSCWRCRWPGPAHLSVPLSHVPTTTMPLSFHTCSEADHVDSAGMGRALQGQAPRALLQQARQPGPAGLDHQEQAQTHRLMHQAAGDDLAGAGPAQGPETSAPPLATGREDLLRLIRPQSGLNSDKLGPQVLLNILADEIHRAHQRCMREESCDVEAQKMDFVFEAGAAAMRLMQGAYSCIALVKGVGLLAFRDPYGIR